MSPTMRSGSSSPLATSKGCCVSPLKVRAMSSRSLSAPPSASTLRGTRHELCVTLVPWWRSHLPNHPPGRA